MAQKIDIRRISNWNSYINGTSLLGKTEKVTPPTLKAKQLPHKALGIVGDIETFAGFEKMEAKLKMSSIYPDVCVQLANVFKPVQIQCRASQQVMEHGGVTREVPVVVLFTGTCKNYPLGDMSQHDNVELEFEFNVLYFKQTVDGRDVVEYDVLANIYKVDGVDLLAAYRANTGA